MKIYVTVETYQGVIDNVSAFKTLKQAERKEKSWLKSMNVQDDQRREHLSFNCTEFQIHKCKLR
jgi:hypothetical protein